MINGYLRPDGRKGIRNNILVCYLVECAHHVAREIVYPHRQRGAQLIGFSGCYPNGHAHKMMERLATHPTSAPYCWSRSDAKVSTRAACSRPRAPPGGQRSW